MIAKQVIICYDNINLISVYDIFTTAKECVHLAINHKLYTYKVV